jgi:SAM-dependent methyltransferase
MGLDQETIATYDVSAVEMAEKFKGIGSRASDVSRAFELVGAPDNESVIEIGCGDGRDACEIVKYTDNYIGIDPSVGLLELARNRRLGATFVQADALSFNYPTEVDIVFAFASLLHVSKGDLRQVFAKIQTSLRHAGIAYISLKERTEYTSEIQSDEFGQRLFYYYTVPDVQEAAGSGFQTVYEDHQHIGKTDWFTLALQKS